MSEVAAPAAAPATPAAAPSAPSAPAADTRGAPPRGHKWAPAAPSAPAPAGKVPVPSQPRTPQQVSTGEPPKVAAKPPQPNPQRVEQQAKPETQAQRAARLEKLRTADGQEVEVDVAELLERALSTEKRKVKVNGQEREVTVAEAFERFPLAESAHTRFREAAAKEQQTQATLDAAKRELAVLKDPTKALGLLERLLGPEALQQEIEKRLSAIYERERMPPEQRKQLEERENAQRSIETERQKLDRERREFEAQRQATAKQEFEQKRNAETERIKRDFPILLKDAGLPQTPRMMARLADACADAYRAKIPMSEKQIAQQLAQEIREELGHFGENADPEVLRTTLGKGADKLREAEVKRVMSQPGRGRTQVAKPGKPPDTIRTPEQLRRWLHQQDLAAERRGR